MHYTEIDFLIASTSIIMLHTMILTDVAVFNWNIVETTLGRKLKFFAIRAIDIVFMQHSVTLVYLI